MNKSMARTTHRLAMMASVAVLAISASVFGPAAFAEQGANSPQQTTIQPKHPKSQIAPQQKQANQQNLQQQQGNKKLNQAVQQQQKQTELQQQEHLQQQKQAAKTQQQQLQQQQKQAEQARLQQQKQANQARLLEQQVKEQKLKAAQQQQKQFQYNQALQQNQAEFRRFDWNTYRPGQRPPLWAQYRQDFDPTPYQWVQNAPRQYVVSYLPPPGWQYQRWNYGQIYPRPYWQQPYWLNNYAQYGLQPLPYGYVWVQNGPDALAVDSFTGVILQVVYGLFSGGGSGGLLGGLL
jgi:parvulin-like peptidyl-prolyl isomerase